MFGRNRMNGMGFGMGRGPCGRGMGQGMGQGMGRGMGMNLMPGAGSGMGPGRGQGRGMGRGMGLRRRDGSCVTGIPGGVQADVPQTEEATRQRIEVLEEEARRLKEMLKQD